MKNGSFGHILMLLAFVIHKWFTPKKVSAFLEAQMIQLLYKTFLTQLLKCYWQNNYVGDILLMLDFSNVKNWSRISHVSHQHLKVLININCLQHPSSSSIQTIRTMISFCLICYTIKIILENSSASMSINIALFRVHRTANKPKCANSEPCEQFIACEQCERFGEIERSKRRKVDSLSKVDNPGLKWTIF